MRWAFSGGGCGCFDGLRWKLRDALAGWDQVQLEGLGDAEELPRDRLLQLAEDLESLSESRVSVDQRLLADLVSRYEAGGPQAPSFRFGAGSSQSWATDLPEVEDIDYKTLPLPTSTSRPILDGTTSQLLLQHLQQHLKEPDAHPLHPHFLMQLLQLTRALHLKRSETFGPMMHVELPGCNVSNGIGRVTVRNATTTEPLSGKIVVLGDTHGQLADFLWAIAENGLPSDKNRYVVNGDVADRSPCSTEIFALLFTFMLQYPSEPAVVINRGNHECMAMNGSRCGGFQYELLNKYGASWGPYLHSLFGAVFALLPVATIISNSVFVVHGGLGRNPEEFFGRLKDLPPDYREPSINPWGSEGDPNMDALVDAVWSDPQPEAGLRVSARGTGSLWGPDYTRRFLQATGFQLIVRSHQVPPDLSGVYLHKEHDDKVVTVFSASNYGGRTNRAGALRICSCPALPGTSPDAQDSNTEEAEAILVEAADLGLCPDWDELQALDLHAQGTPSSVRARLQRAETVAKGSTLQEELLQQAMGLLAEFRVPLWKACTEQDLGLRGLLELPAWNQICRQVTKHNELDWALIAALVGGTTENHIRYTETLNRFGFRIASRVVASGLAESVLANIYQTIMHADDSLQQLVGKLCQAGREHLPARKVLQGFCELLSRNGVSGPEMDAVTRSLEAHISGRKKDTVDIAEFLSAWRCASGIRADLDLTKPQLQQASEISRLLSAPRRYKKRISSLAPASAATLMEFFTSADSDGDGYMSVEEGHRALCQHLELTTGRKIDEPRSSDLRGLLLAADVTCTGRLNYLEFLRLFDRQDSQCLTAQSLLDLHCFQVWAHRNALSGLYRYIGTNGRISEAQIRWSLNALNSSVEGKLLDANIESLVSAIKFSDDSTVGADEFLHAFQLYDKLDRPKSQ